MNFRPAPLQMILAVKRRLEATTPGAVLDEATVKLVAIPQTQFDATVFTFFYNGEHRLVAEFCRAGLPHVYVGKTVDPTAKGSAAALVWVIGNLGWRILNDPRFSARGNIIQINGVVRS